MKTLQNFNEFRTPINTAALLATIKELKLEVHEHSLLALFKKAYQDFNDELNRIEFRGRFKAKELKKLLRMNEGYREKWASIDCDALELVDWLLGGHGPEYGTSNTAIDELFRQLQLIDRECNFALDLLGSSQGALGGNRQNPNAPPAVALYPVVRLLSDWWNDSMKSPLWNPKFVGEEGRPREADGTQAKLLLGFAQALNPYYVEENCFSANDSVRKQRREASNAGKDQAVA